MHSRTKNFSRCFRFASRAHWKWCHAGDLSRRAAMTKPLPASSQDAGAEQPASPAEMGAVSVEQVKLLYANMPVSQSVALVNGAALAIVQYSVVDAGQIATWLACLIVITLLRGIAAMRFTRAAPSRDEIPQWRTYFFFGVAASALIWGSTALFLYPLHSVPHQTFLAFVLGGVVAGSVAVLTPVFPLFALFAVGALVPTIVRFLAEGSPMHMAMGVMSIVFLLAILTIGRRMSTTIEQTLQLRLENRDLVARLTSEKAQVENVNAELLSAQDELRRANEALEVRVRERTAALEELDRRKDDFLAMLSHELRNPLAPIRASIYIQKHVDPASPQARHAREVIERQSQYMNRLVDDLLDVTRIARGKIELHREPVDLAEIAARTVEDHRSIFRRLDISLTTDMPASAVPVHVDRTRMAQVIGNLLQNAAKFTPAGGKAAVTLRAVEGHAELRVSDTGAGISPELLPVLFEPFSQGDRSLARTAGGLGLGLSLARDIIELHGGTVRVESGGLNKGSTFIVRLPLYSAPADSEIADAVEPGDPAHRHVLVVDDNHDAADTLAQIVRMFGHSADVAYEGSAAIEKARVHPPDVVLCDIGLPGMSGYELARRLRAQQNDIRLIAVSGYARPQDIDRANSAGFNGHVAKPPDPEAVKRLIG
jgi:signal transduction histidine kinase